MSNLTEQDLRGAIQAKSDQINADDLSGGPLACQIVDVRRGSADQPVHIIVDAHKQPWKPSKTSLRVLAACWGADPSAWIGRYAVLYNDESVKWAGAAVGGIRTSHLSHISGVKKVAVNETRGKKAVQTIQPYIIDHPEPGCQQEEEPKYYPEDRFEQNLPKWIELIDSGNKTVDQVVKSVERGGKLTVGQRARIKMTEEVEGDGLPDAMEEAPPAMDDPWGNE